MKNKFWNIVGLFYTKFVNRMRCGDNREINNWQTFPSDVSYEKYNTINNPILPIIQAHTFWHGDIGPKQIFCLKSFLCTQDMKQFEIILWLDGDDCYEKALKNAELSSLMTLSNHKIIIKKWDIKKEIIGTPFERKKWYFKWERILPFVADDFRIICLYKYGGLYFDLDIMFVKDFIPLLMRGEFVYAWENQPFANNALLYFRKGSYLINVVAREMVKHLSSQPWILFKYKNKKLSSLIVYPCSMFDPLWVGYSSGMPIKTFEEFFRKFDATFCRDNNIGSYKDFFKGIYAYHWHNNWKAEIHKDSYFGIFNEEFTKKINNAYLRNNPSI